MVRVNLTLREMGMACVIQETAWATYSMGWERNGKNKWDLTGIK